MNNHHNLPRKTRESKLNDVFTIAQTVEVAKIPKRTLYRRIESGVIQPIIFAEQFFLSRETVNKLKKQAA